MNILIVRLGALGDVVHAIPAAAALRAAMPDARIDWLVEAKHRPIVDLVTVVDRGRGARGPVDSAWADVIRRMRQVRYDVAFDFQGLMKSAVLARASGAARVAGFSIWHLREKGARPFYSETDDTLDDDDRARDPEESSSPRVVGVETSRVEFPLADSDSPALDQVRREIGPGAVAHHQPGRGVAEQAMAAVALWRSGGVSPRGARAVVDRALGAWRAGARAGGRRRFERRRPTPPRRQRSPISWRSRGRQRWSCRVTPGRCTSPRPSAHRRSRSLARPTPGGTGHGRRMT